tara:strand:+ start:672 stop:857 length:186 start_codon:yes stop_codon:yes gene_type:complete
VKVGDLVEAMRAKDLLIQRGIILSHLNVHVDVKEKWTDIYEVMTTDGIITTYTSAALRVIR